MAPSRKPAAEKAELEFPPPVGVAAQSLPLVLSAGGFKDLVKSVLTLSASDKISPTLKGPPVYLQMGRWKSPNWNVVVGALISHTLESQAAFVLGACCGVT